MIALYVQSYLIFNRRISYLHLLLNLWFWNCSSISKNNVQINSKIWHSECKIIMYCRCALLKRMVQLFSQSSFLSKPKSILFMKFSNLMPRCIHIRLEYDQRSDKKRSVSLPSTCIGRLYIHPGVNNSLITGIGSE